MKKLVLLLFCVLSVACGGNDKASSNPPFHVITFNGNGGLLAESGTGIYYRTYGDGEIVLGVLPTPSRTDYVFLGWSTSQSGVVNVTPYTLITGNATYYARWEGELGLDAVNELSRKLNKLEAATYKYYQRFYALPDENDTKVPLKTYYDIKLLAQTDMTFDNRSFSLYRCNQNLEPLSDGQEFCVRTEIKEAHACQLERLMDDASYATGRGRLPGYSMPASCVDNGSLSTVTYTYRVDPYEGRPISRLPQHLRKLERAVHLYYSYVNYLPIDESGAFDVQLLKDRGLLSDADLVYGGFAAPLFGCAADRSYKPTGFANICVQVVAPLADACNVENERDDDSYQTGEGRILTHQVDYSDICAEQTQVTYVYRVF